MPVSSVARHHDLDDRGEGVNNHSSSARPSQLGNRERPFPFLGLPKELRLKVYENIPEVTKRPLPLNLKNEPTDEIYWRQWTIDTAILDTNKTISHEASAVLWQIVTRLQAETMILEVIVHSAKDPSPQFLNSPGTPSIFVDIVPVVYSALIMNLPLRPLTLIGRAGCFLQSYAKWCELARLTPVEYEADRSEANWLLHRTLMCENLEIHLLYDSNACSVLSICFKILQVLAVAHLARSLPTDGATGYAVKMGYGIKVAERGGGELLLPEEFAEKHKDSLPLEYFNMLTGISQPPSVFRFFR
ncbi:hypothetical protein BU16DRAFT_618923 [Lophium mytilinum]|uniref:F-box domain-containing protein n=1 Tax=Lophium mytilinum TaxID=390894 RepID=A0A6A6QVR9_9PEZI|nr:hypothetical protein BU16DRAFT_618923 [Lophium mytilinum]